MLEALEKDNGQFVVLGFDDTQTGQDGHARVLKKDGTDIWIPITKKDQLVIDGKKYGRTYWRH